MRANGIKSLNTKRSTSEVNFLNIRDATTYSKTGDVGSADMAVLLSWINSYLMASHTELGRTGAVCPFTKQAAKIGTVRVALSSATPSQEQNAFALVRQAFDELNCIPSPKGMDHFRTVIIGFPAFESETGIAVLKKIQRAHRYYSLSRGRMLGLMYATSPDIGLWNRDFRPLRSPIPIIAVRHMVEHDAPFAAIHPALLLAYLTRFPVNGARRLISHWRKV